MLSYCLVKHKPDSFKMHQARKLLVVSWSCGLRHSSVAISSSSLVRSRKCALDCSSTQARSFVTSRTTRQAIVPPSPPRPPSSQGLGILTMALFFTGAGCVIAAIPAISSAADLITPPSDEETLLRFVPDNELARHIDSYIQTHPLTVSLRSQPRFTESRPHLRIPEAQRRNHFTGGVLIGPEKVTVPPIVWTEQGGKSQVTIAYLGADLCGHPGDIHGGLLATMLDEGLARCSFGALPNGVGMTANLKVDYRSPAAAESFIVLRARTTKVEGRKAWVEGSVETLATPGKAPVLLAEASGLFIEPRQAAVCQRLR